MVRKTSSKRKTTRKKTRKTRKAKKKNTKTKSTEVVYHSTKEIKVEKALIENFIGLQKVMVNLSGKFDNLANQISKLLELFEISARALARKDSTIPGEEGESKKVIEKLDTLSKQAGLIGKGLALIHEVGTENEKPVIPLQKRPPLQVPQQPQRPMPPMLRRPQMPMKKPVPSQTTQDISESNLNGFEKSKDTGERP